MSESMNIEKKETVAMVFLCVSVFVLKVCTFIALSWVYTGHHVLSASLLGL
jgi:hypothetical protein